MPQSTSFHHLSRRALLCGAAGLLIPSSSFAKTGEAAGLIFRLTNQVRVQAGTKPLRTSMRLNQAAATFSEVLAKTQNLSHKADGGNLSNRVAAVNYRFATLGENIGWTSKGRSDRDIAGDLVGRWMASRGHRRNILNRRFKHLGVGVTLAQGRTYAVQIFGAEQS